MALTIYTVSDPAVVSSVMTSMAMFFGQESWVGGALKLALIISLLVILAKGVLAREGLRLDAMLLQLLVIMVAFIPKTTVVIEQFEHNAPTHVVDDVPYAIAMPGAIAGTFALFMTQKIETVMSSVDGKYIAPSGELDPFAPARMLMQIATAPLDPTRFVDPNLLQTIHHAARFCGKPGMTNIKFEQSKNSFAAFASEMMLDGTKTFIFDEANPYRDGGGSGRWATCEEAAMYIRDIGAQLESNNAMMFEKTMKGIAQTSDTKRYSDTQTGATNDKTADDLLPILNRVTPAHANINALALGNVMSYTAFAQLARDSKGGVENMIEMQRDTGLFVWAKEESAKSLLVSATAPKFMDILFFIFIASTPIVMFVVAANPATGFKVAGAYVLFGLWTQSWIPMMAIIGGWYQAEIKNFATPGLEGITPEYLSALMRHVSTATITASSMLQSAPYMMFAIMTGSMFAMSSMIAKVAPSGGAAGGGTGAGTGAGGGTSPLGGDLVGTKSVGPAQAQQMRQAQSMVNGTSGYGGINPGGDVAAAIPGLPTLNQGGDLGAQTSAAKERSAATRNALQKGAERNLSAAHSMVQASSSYVKGEQLAKAAQEAGYNVSYDAATKSIAGDGVSYNAKDGFSSTSRADVGGKGGISGKLMGFAAAISAGIAKIAQDGVSLDESRTKGQREENSNGGGVAGKEGESASVGTGGARGAEMKNTAQSANQLSDSLKKSATQSQSLDEADKLTSNASSSTSAGTSTALKGSDIAQNWGARNSSPTSQDALTAVVGAIGGELGQKLQGSIAQFQSQIEKSGAGATLNKDAIAAGAAMKALEAMKNSGAPGDSLKAMSGMASLAKAAGMQDISPALSQLAKAEGLVQDVGKSIAQTEATVKPAVAAATGAVDAKLTDGAAAEFRANVAQQQQRDQGTAEGLLANAQGGLANVDTAGRAAHAGHVAANHAPAKADAGNVNPLAEFAAGRMGERPAVPDITNAALRFGGSPEGAQAAENKGSEKHNAQGGGGWWRRGKDSRAIRQCSNENQMKLTAEMRSAPKAANRYWTRVL